jgi:hypothetical protein
MRATLSRRTGVLMLVLCLSALCAQFARGGLYGDEGKEKKTGDIADQDYWWTAFDMKMLDLAIKQHQPEGHIGFNLVGTSKRLDDLTKKYPNHEGIKEWKKKVDEVTAAIDPNAERTAPWKPGMPWDESNFAQLWVNYHWAKGLIEQKDLTQAQGLLQNVEQNLDVMLKPDRMKEYPEDLRKWVKEEAKPDTDKMYKELKARHS